MNCPQCSNQMVIARATNHGPEYEYCRTCKKELAEMTMQKHVENEFGTDIYKREFMQVEPKPDPRIGSRHSPARLTPRMLGRYTLPSIMQAFNAFQGVSHLMTPQEDGTTLYFKDRSCQEKCRSVCQVPVHFFHRKNPAPYVSNTPCACQTYKRPGIINAPATGPTRGPGVDDDEDAEPMKKHRDRMRLDDDGGPLMTMRQTAGLTMQAARLAEQEMHSRGIMAEFEYFMPHDSFSLIVHKDHAAEADRILKEIFRREAAMESAVRAVDRMKKVGDALKKKGAA